MMPVLVAFGLMLMGFALYLRSAIVSLNKDMRAILDNQSALRDRCAAIEAEQAHILALTKGDGNG